MAKHAYLAASASERWLHCPPSAKLCAQEEDQGSPYAQQGTDAHELCQHLLEKALGRQTRDPTEDLTYYDTEMQEAAEGYASFVMEQVAEAKTLCADPLICVEQTVDFSKWVPHGFGTADALIVADDLLYITDFKYGVGCLVSADGEDGTGNSQLKCYALGALDTFGDLYSINRIRLSIYQPRRENVDTFELTKADLLKWADDAAPPRQILRTVSTIQSLDSEDSRSKAVFSGSDNRADRRSIVSADTRSFPRAFRPWITRLVIYDSPVISLFVRCRNSILTWFHSYVLYGPSLI